MEKCQKRQNHLAVWTLGSLRFNQQRNIFLKSECLEHSITSRRLWLHWSELGPNNLLINKQSKCFWCSWSKNHTLRNTKKYTWSLSKYKTHDLYMDDMEEINTLLLSILYLQVFLFWMRVCRSSSTKRVGTNPNVELLVIAMLSNLLFYANFIYLGLLRDWTNCF